MEVPFIKKITQILYLYCDGGQIVLRFAVTFTICAMVKGLANLGMLSSASAMVSTASKAHPPYTPTSNQTWKTSLRQDMEPLPVLPVLCVLIEIGNIIT